MAVGDIITMFLEVDLTMDKIIRTILLLRIPKLADIQLYLREEVIL